MLFMSGFHLRSALSICWTLILGGNIECSILMSITNACLYFSKNKISKKTLQICTKICFNKHIISLIFKNFSVSKPLWIDTMAIWTPHLDENGAIVIANENHTIWNSCFRFVALAVGVIIQYIYPTSRKYAIKCSVCVSVVFIIFYALFMGTFHLISWFPFSFIDIIKVSVV